MPDLRVCIDVPDLERGLAFYTEGLGFGIGRRLGADWVELVGGPCPVDLLVAAAGSLASPAAAARRGYDRHWTPVHLDLSVPDVEAAVQRAVLAGARLERGPLDRPYGRLAILSDPFGHGFCFLEFRGRGYDVLVAAGSP